jgi:AcrR family transcriptional regulator
MLGSKAHKPDVNVRGKLLACATDLFNRKGYAATTVREIVEAAGVTKPVLYYYFNSKEGIYLEIMRHLREDFEQQLEACRGRRGSAAERVCGLCDEMFSLFLHHTDYVRLIYSIYYGPPQGAPFFDLLGFHAKLQGAIQQTVEEGIEAGEFRKASAEDMTLAILGALQVVVETHLTHPEMAVGNQGLARILDVMFSGIAAEKPREKGNKR